MKYWFRDKKNCNYTNILNFFSGYEGSTWAIWVFNTFFIYLVNFVILGGCLVKLLVYGDSVPKSQSKEAGLFYKHKRLAGNNLKKVSES